MATKQDAAYHRRWRTEHPERWRDILRRSRNKRREAIKIQRRKWAALNPDKILAASKRYRAAHPDRLLAYRKKWYAKNHDKSCASSRKWAADHPQKNRAKSAKWVVDHPEENRAKSAAYRALKLRAMPSWIDRGALLVVYREAARRSLTVDHIVPLKNRHVCGLHVPWNLQLLTRFENSSKGNRMAFEA